MDAPKENLFLHTIFQLRKEEDVVLYTKLIETDERELLLVNDFLEEEYRLECYEYPFTPPPYDEKAAIWGAKTFYTVAQLILFREHKERDLVKLLPAYDGTLNAGAILSADLCLRFLPQLLAETKNFDAEDILIVEINNILKFWHYSGIGEELPGIPEFDVITEDKSLLQLYINRIIEKKDKKRAVLPVFFDLIKGNLGLYQPQFWKELLY